MTRGIEWKLFARLLQRFGGNGERNADASLTTRDQPQCPSGTQVPGVPGPEAAAYHDVDAQWSRENAEAHARRVLCPGVFYGGYR